MHVPGNPAPRLTRPPFAAAVVVMFASVVGIAQAVEFDEKVKTPQSKDAVEMGAKARSYSERAAQVRSAGIAAAVRDRNLAATRFDVEWEIQRAIDFSRPIGDLVSEGIVDRGDGSYGVDLGAHPQWDDPAEQLAIAAPLLSQAGVAAELTRRGMRPEDFAKVRDYVATHDLQTATAAAALPIAVSFSRVVKKLDKIKRPVSDALVFSYIYQRERATTEARRVWAEGLVDSLGESGLRVLESYIDEMKSTAIWSPSDPRAGIDGMLAILRRSDFEQKATAEAKGVTP